MNLKLNSDFLINVGSIDIFLNKDIIRRSSVNSGNLFDEDEDDIANDIAYADGKCWTVKRMDDFCGGDVIRFFKFIVPGFDVELNGKRFFVKILMHQFSKCILNEKSQWVINKIDLIFAKRACY